MTDDSKSEKKRTLEAIFRRLGSTQPESLASSQVEENIPQLAQFIFLKQAWNEMILDEENPDDWIDDALRAGEEHGGPWLGGQSKAITGILAKGVTRQELATLVQCVQYGVVAKMCCQLEQAEGNPINVKESEEWPRVRWKLFQTDEAGNCVASLDGLHEYALCHDPTGKEHGFGVRLAARKGS